MKAVLIEIIRRLGVVRDMMPNDCKAEVKTYNLAIGIVSDFLKKDDTSISVDIEVWKTWFGADYFVAMKCGDRKLHMFVSRQRYQAEYHLAEMKWFLGQGEKPSLMNFSEATHPNNYPNIHPADAPERATA